MLAEGPQISYPDFSVCRTAKTPSDKKGKQQCDQPSWLPPSSEASLRYWPHHVSHNTAYLLCPLNVALPSSQLAAGVRMTSSAPTWNLAADLMVKLTLFSLEALVRRALILAPWCSGTKLFWLSSTCSSLSPLIIFSTFLDTLFSSTSSSTSLSPARSRASLRRRSFSSSRSFAMYSFGTSSRKRACAATNCRASLSASV
mmetsp:Transcript_11364/g.22212  ORF Transcript_11364/g.22212 Transcript_11364/m.22212 type:complete len:200 (-) Transcript_11364:817-1416(-)